MEKLEHNCREAQLLVRFIWFIKIFPCGTTRVCLFVECGESDTTFATPTHDPPMTMSGF